MIRLTKLADYGIALMSRLNSDQGNEQMTARQLAEEMGLPLPTVSKILKMMTQGGLLISRRGVSGGYTLSRPADRITIVDMIAALEGPLTLTDCVREEEDCTCELSEACGLKGPWARINRDILETLGAYTLQQMSDASRAVTRDTANELVSEG